MNPNIISGINPRAPTSRGAPSQNCLPPQRKQAAIGDRRYGSTTSTTPGAQHRAIARRTAVGKVAAGPNNGASASAEDDPSPKTGPGPLGTPVGDFKTSGRKPRSPNDGPAIPYKLSHQFSIGIESEFLLQGKEEATRSKSLQEFLVRMAALHNQKVSKDFPRMETQFQDDDWWPGQIDYDYWLLTEEYDIALPPERPSKWGVEMKTPKIKIYENADWANQIKETWAFVQKNYLISTNFMCSTHIHISVRRDMPPSGGGLGMGLKNLKKIAQAAIHFEPALEPLLTEKRRGNIYVSSNWIDNAMFKKKEITRRVAIQMIEACKNEGDVINLMCPEPQNRYFAWNFRAMKRFGTIEYRKGSPSVNASEALAWAELTILFVDAALQSTPKSLAPIPANVRGLKGFLGADKLKYLKPMFSRMNGAESLQPQLLIYNNLEEEEMLQRKLGADEEKQKRLAQGQQPGP